ncbi:heme oxygenase 1, chloroplastic isoform X2 [Cryptomeria japonica]|uniref:heme oxygenase 1, chloroplastic isoform X2 n=1 Tax=Cryptomeria japonica TaxID=3369 RepID=UPI0025AD4A16|nr:heme oxygenase 1, chloroplastic isoform X2 [Cryptomeria japonica]
MAMTVYMTPQLPIFGQDRPRAISVYTRPELPIYRNDRARAMSIYMRPQLPRFRQDSGRAMRVGKPILMLLDAPAQAEEKRRKLLPGEAKGFTEEMRFVAMRLHTKQKEPQSDPQQPQGAWEASLKGYLSFLVDSKLVHDKLDAILLTSPHPSYAAFRNTGLERSEKLTKDLEWFVQQGSKIPEPSSSGRSYSQYLEELAEKNPPSFICHFYNIHFAHITGGQNIGRQGGATKVCHILLRSANKMF